jgi:tetratricopeptide (TPR) repeat protein
MGEAEARPLLEEGERHLQSGDYEGAERAFSKAVEAAPESAVAYSKLGVALASQHRHDAAISHFNRAITLQPGYAPAYSNLGNAYREKGMQTEAVMAYERALAIDPDYWVAHQNLGALYKEMGRLGEAVPHFKKAMRLSARRTSKPGERERRMGCLGSTSAALVFVLVFTLLMLAR